jgi:hypothetical protein
LRPRSGRWLRCHAPRIKLLYQPPHHQRYIRGKGRLIFLYSSCCGVHLGAIDRGNRSFCSAHYSTFCPRPWQHGSGLGTHGVDAQRPWHPVPTPGVTTRWRAYTIAARKVAEELFTP